VNDQVSGITYASLQVALLTKPGSVQEFKNSIKSQYPSQANQIDALFLRYGY
jgi:hypothetical protein